MTVDDVIGEVRKQWATGEWTTIAVAIGEDGNESVGFVPCVTAAAVKRGDNGLENGKARRGLKKAIKKGRFPVGMIATSEGMQKFLTLAGSGFSVGRDPNTGKECFERYHTDA
jgi:hypothetical protein